MATDLREKVKAFRTAMCVVKEMLTVGIISNDDYAEIESIIAETMGVSSCTIFR